jgi:Zn-dependent peptidase ImmA (M78 family)
VLVTRGIDDSLEVYHEGVVEVSKKSRRSPKVESNGHFAHITGSVLTWAIERSNETRETLAKKAKVKLQDLERWEQGTPVPFKKAEAIANGLKVPFGILFLSEPPDLTIKLPDMRRRVRTYHQSPNFIELVHDAQLRQDWYRDLLRSDDEPTLSFVGRFNVLSPIKEVALDIRKTLRIGREMRQAAKRQAQYLNALSEAAEAQRILVMRSGFVKNNNHRRVDVREFQGFALADSLAPVVFVNANDYDTAQVFTLVHEIVHIWIGETGISQPTDGIANTNAIERFCNAVAAEVLVPESEFRPAWNTDSGDGRVQRLARRYWVSKLVIVNRAVELGLITVIEGRRLRRAVQPIYVHEPVKKKSGSGNYFATAAIRASRRLTDAVATQASRGSLVFREAARLLGMSQFLAAKLSLPKAS